MMGFGKVIYVATEKEMEWMRLPTKHEERVHTIDYSNYTSPDPDIPGLGFLAVAAVKLLSPYVRNFVL